jgi:AcrR family transcriptional regulator
MPRETLTSQQIVRTTIDLLDAEGLEGLSMRDLGARLGSAATAVYWHVKSKEQLLRLAGDAVWSEIELPDLSAVDWRTAATAMGNDLRAMFSRHPWLVQAFGSQFFYGPGKARHDDHSLALYERAGFGGAEADQAMATVFMFVLGSALGESASVRLKRQLSRDGGNPDELIRDALLQATEIALGFPRLRARLEREPVVEYAAAPEQSFEFGLQAIMDGLEERLAGRRTQPLRARPRSRRRLVPTTTRSAR